jgi:hypothetical protein
MRVLVTGGRDFLNQAFVWNTLTELARTAAENGDKIHLAEGGANGADTLAYQWAIEHDIHVDTYVAQWNRDGNAAGPIRNAHMLTDFKPDLVVAFPGGKGTADMIAKARRKKIEVREFAPNN